MFKQLLPDKLQPNAQFFRLLVLMVLACVVIVKFPWLNGLLARVIDMPDVRHNVTYQDIDNQNLFVKINIINLGQVKADNVLIHFYARDGKIGQFFIDSQDSYVIQQQNLENGSIDIKLERLAPGAQIFIEITGQIDQSKIYFSVTSNQGTSISTDLPSFSSQVQENATSMTSLYDKTIKLIENNSPFDAPKLLSWVNQKIIGFADLISLFRSEDFKTALSAIFVLSMLIGLFLPHLAWLIPLFAAVGIFFLANFQLSLGFIIALSLITLSPGLLSIAKSMWKTRQDTRFAEWIFPLMWITILLSPFAFWNQSISARWLAIPSAMIVLYILSLVSIIIPKERGTPLIQSNEHRLLIQTEQSAQDNNRVENLSFTLEQTIETLDNLNLAVTQTNQRLSDIEQELFEQCTAISQMSQKYSAIIRVIRKENSQNIDNEGKTPHINA